MPWPVFPKCPTFGFTKRADYSVTIVERASGIRSVNRNWYYPLHIFSAVPMGDRQEDDIHTVARFWHAVGGMSGQFLFNDYTDYKSSITLAADVTAADQPLTLVDGSPSGYQMLKVYEDDEFAYSQQRLIQKPKPGTVRVANTSGVEQTAGTFSVDYVTGIINALGGFSGTPGFWGGEFYVPVMFETVPEFMMSNYKIQQTSFALRELRLQDP